MSYFQDLSEEGKMALRLEFQDPKTSHERRVELVTMLRDAANEARMGRSCLQCKNYPFVAIHDEPLIEGHVYSHAGKAEIQISGICEFCFDRITVEPIEEGEQ